MKADDDELAVLDGTDALRLKADAERLVRREAEAAELERLRGQRRVRQPPAPTRGRRRGLRMTPRPGQG
jgi:hypothetical protein